jgi:tetratricopeptide (TPR) repeat protein
VINAGYIDMSVPFAAGGLYPTTEDLLRWEQGEYIAKKLAAVVHGEKVNLPAATATKEITVSPSVLESYVGTYELTPPFNIVVTLEDGQLMMQVTGQLKVPLLAESETKFFLKVVDAQVEFFKNEKGEVTHLMLHQNGRDTKGANISHFSATYYLQQGVDHYTKGDYRQAIQDFSEAIRLDPKTPRALLDRGIANLYAGHFSDAHAGSQPESALGSDRSLQHDVALSVTREGWNKWER